MVAPNLKEKLKNGELDLSSQGLKEIPQNIAALSKNASSINLSNNKIATVGKLIGTLPHLVKLDLSKNQIKGLPECIGNLTALRHLNLADNHLMVLPASIGQLKSLQVLDLKNNPLSSKFSEIVGQCQNERQCQLAAKNVLKEFGPKKSQDQDSKKKKPANGLQDGPAEGKQKNKSKKKAKKSFGSQVGFVFGTIFKCLFAFVCLTTFVMYTLSFLDEARYDRIMASSANAFNNTFTPYLGEKTTDSILDGAAKFGQLLNRMIVSSVKFVYVKLYTLFVYLTTDETLRSFYASIGTAVYNAWLTVLDFFQNLLSSGKKSETVK